MTTHKTAPFDLKKFLAGEPICYANGNQPLDSHYMEKADCLLTFPYIGSLYTHVPNTGEAIFNNNYSLFMLIEPIKKSCWVNIYKNGKIEGGFSKEFYATDYHNTNCSMFERVACIQIEYEVNE